MSNLNDTAVKKYQARFGEEPGVRELATERQRWQQICQELVEELGQVQDDCEHYRRLSQKLLPFEFNQEIANLTADQAQQVATKGQSLDELIKETFSS